MIERIPIPRDLLEVTADLTVRLVQLRQNECKHLCIENVGPEIWGKLLRETWQPSAFLPIKVGCGNFRWRSGDFCGNCGYHHSEHP